MRPYNRIAACLAALFLASISIGIRQDQERLTKTEVKDIPFKVLYQFDRSLGPGRLLKVRAGIPGAVRRLVEYKEQNGKLVRGKVVGEVRMAPVDAIFAMGRHGAETTRGSFTRDKVLTMNASGYSHEENTNWTCMGLRAEFGVVAIDPRVIRLGTRVYVEGYGFAIAGDTGGAIKGTRIDLCFDSRAQAMRFGRKQVVVHVLG